MKKLVALFLLSAAFVQAQEIFDLGARGRLKIYLPPGWTADVSSIAAQHSMTITHKKEDVNASCTIAVSFPDVDRFDTKARLKLRVEADGLNYAEGSVEGKAVAKEFSLTTGYGFYCSFTDPELRGKPPQKGNYKNISAGKIHLTPEVLLDVAISADGLNSSPYQELLGAIEGMEFSPGGRR